MWTPLSLCRWINTPMRTCFARKELIVDDAEAILPRPVARTTFWHCARAQCQAPQRRERLPVGEVNARRSRMPRCRRVGQRTSGLRERNRTVTSQPHDEGGMLPDRDATSRHVTSKCWLWT